ncbi:hypothetical protein QL285_091225 [Trifolium repens]|nr:hypothetical protein QL285_091225 [Trifolium repens]
MLSEKSIIKTRCHTDCDAQKSSAALSCTFPLLQIFLFKQFLVTHDTMTPFVASVSGLLRSSGVFRSHSSIFSNSLSLFPIPAPAAHVDQSACHHRVASSPPCPFFPSFIFLCFFS